MNGLSPNLQLLTSVARRIAPLLERVVLVGGCATDLLLTDPAAGRARPTGDVDVVVSVRNRSEYHEVGEDLRRLGFREDTAEDAPICRWVSDGRSHDRLVLDVMPVEEDVLGFTNPWYAPAFQAAQLVPLDAEIIVRAVTAPYFIATKLEAFRTRGAGQYLSSHDLEDIIVVVDGRPELPDEVTVAAPDVRAFLASQFTRFLHDGLFLDALPGFLYPDAASQARVPMLLERFERIARSDG